MTTTDLRPPYVQTPHPHRRRRSGGRLDRKSVV